MTWVVTGATGLLGPYLLQAIDGLYRVSTERIDLSEPYRMVHYLKYLNPSVVIHTAAYTDVDGCEHDPAWAEKINHRAVEDVVNGLGSSTKLVYISTDMVYPDTRGPHRENEVKRPVNTYGLTKRLGEIAALKHHNTLVLRTNFFGKSMTPGRKSFSDFVMESGNEQEFFDDVLFSPLHLSTLAELVVECVERNLIGVFNAGSRDGFSKHEFAQHVSRKIRKKAKASFNVPRPSDLRMDVARLESRLGRAMPSLIEEITEHVT